MPRMIKVWRFEDAPEEYRKLSENGGDEDWLALIPAEMSNEYIGWCDPVIGTDFGCCDISDYKLPDGSLVRIGSHA